MSYIPYPRGYGIVSELDEILNLSILIYSKLFKNWKQFVNKKRRRINHSPLKIGSREQYRYEGYDDVGALYLSVLGWLYIHISNYAI